MTDREQIAALEQQLEAACVSAEADELHALAFIIDRFCGGEIEFKIDEISRAWGTIDICRTYDDRDGTFTYVTKRHCGEQVDDPAF